MRGNAGFHWAAGRQCGPGSMWGGPGKACVKLCQNDRARYLEAAAKHDVLLSDREDNKSMCLPNEIMCMVHEDPEWCAPHMLPEEAL